LRPRPRTTPGLRRHTTLAPRSFPRSSPTQAPRHCRTPGRPSARARCCTRPGPCSTRASSPSPTPRCRLRRKRWRTDPAPLLPPTQGSSSGRGSSCAPPFDAGRVPASAVVPTKGDARRAPRCQEQGRHVHTAVLPTSGARPACPARSSARCTVGRRGLAETLGLGSTSLVLAAESHRSALLW
jgi:hypothetical protein